LDRAVNNKPLRSNFSATTTVMSTTTIMKGNFNMLKLGWDRAVINKPLENEDEDNNER
jgi:hypothetical protein